MHLVRLPVCLWTSFLTVLRLCTVVCSSPEILAHLRRMSGSCSPTTGTYSMCGSSRTEDTGQSKGYGFVTMAAPNMAQVCC